jgi:hypothetical protein
MGGVWWADISKPRDFEFVDRQESGIEVGIVEVVAAGVVSGGMKSSFIGERSPSSSDPDVEQKTESGSRGVLAPPVDFDTRMNADWSR